LPAPSKISNEVRVRALQSDGSEREVVLKTYWQARSSKNIEAQIVSFMEEGLSARSAARVSGKALSSSELSRRFVAHSAGRLEEFRRRDLSKDDSFGLMIDGVFLSRELVVIVALGVQSDGSKRVLDFSVGSTENYEVAKGLLARLVERQFKVSGRLYAVLDGAKALHKAVMEFWPDAVIQDCVIHKERNIYPHLRKSDHEECGRLFKRLRLAEGSEAGMEALQDLRKFLKARNAQALASLEESGERLIALQKLNVPATLNTSLQSTNLIENAIHNYRRQTSRVTRWNPKGDQVERWSATAFLWVERGFRKIKGHQEIGELVKALARV
jgi:transposase-like protein